MCFSASASFTAAAVIGTISVFTVKSSWNNQYRYFGTVPVLFAIQQAAEGFIWNGLNNSEQAYLLPYFTKVFLLFAWSIWPILIPLSMYQIETVKWKKIAILITLILGISTALISIFHLLNNEPLAYISSFHIDYKLAIPIQNEKLTIVQEIIYGVCTLVPLFLSSSKKMYVFATANLISLVLAFVFFEHALPSTWCFFAAILSGFIYYFIQLSAKNEVKNTLSD